MIKITWRQVGNGKKLHAFFVQTNEAAEWIWSHSLCGCLVNISLREGSKISNPQKTFKPKCSTCERIIKQRLHNECIAE